MPLYRFHIESSAPTEVVMERIHGLVRATPAFWSSLKEQFRSRPDNAPPFIGTLEGSAFHIRRDIRYRNSFLPRIHGRVAASRWGTRIDITMSLHPLVTIFMLFWLGGVGLAGLAAAPANPRDALAPVGMFVFGIALTLGGFFPEAFKARRLLEHGLAGAQPNAAGDARNIRAGR